MQRYLCFNPEYQKEITKAFEEYAIRTMYGEILMAKDIIDEYKNSDEE